MQLRGCEVSISAQNILFLNDMFFSTPALVRSRCSISFTFLSCLSSSPLASIALAEIFAQKSVAHLNVFGSIPVHGQRHAYRRHAHRARHPLYNEHIGPRSAARRREPLIFLPTHAREVTRTCLPTSQISRKPTAPTRQAFRKSLWASVFIASGRRSWMTMDAPNSQHADRNLAG